MGSLLRKEDAKIRILILSIALLISSQPTEICGDGYEEVCFLYSSKNQSEEPLLSLRPSVKVFETNLVFDLESEEGVDVESVKLAKSNCSVILCDEKNLEGKCSQFTHTSESIPADKVHKNVKSADCHCSPVPDNKTEAAKSPRLRRIRLFHNAPQSVNKSSSASLCADIFSDWHYQGGSTPLIFPGSVSRLGADSSGSRQRVRSISVRNECTALLWGSSRKKQTKPDKESQDVDVEFATSYKQPVSFIQLNESDNFQWACCYCDQYSERVCSSAHQQARQFSSSVPLAQEDFSKFVERGKKIVGIGRNYRWQNVEIAQVLQLPSEPIIFLKPTTSYLKVGEKIELPQTLGPIFYELELGLVIGKRGRNISEADALDYIAGYFLGLDMTAKAFLVGRNVTNGVNLPWEIGKGFDSACPVGSFIPKHLIPDPNKVDLEAKVNGNVTQSDSTSNMIFNVNQIIAYVSKYMTLEPHDAIMTGTPDGFGVIKPGDVVEGRVGKLSTIKFEAVASSRN